MLEGFYNKEKTPKVPSSDLNHFNVVLINKVSYINKLLMVLMDKCC